MGGKSIWVAAGLALVTMAACATDMVAPDAPHVVAAVANSARPKADTDRDSHRKPAEMLAFAGVKPGTVIGELIPGGGYFTRVFSKAVGPTGKVYALIAPVAPPAAGAAPRPVAVRTIAADPAYSNVTVIEGPLTSFKTPQPVDLVWTSQNYHDLRPADRPGVNKAAFDALKPGGIYIVLDHSAVKGAGEGVHLTLHRADEDIVRAEVLAAGFKLEGESTVLRNPADNRTTRVFDNVIRGDTDQFILKFRKPR